MKHRLDINDNIIISAVMENFDINLETLEFLPVGEGAWSYKGIDVNKHTWFIKICREDTSNIAQITTYLNHEAGLPFVLSSILSKDYSKPSKVQDYYLNIYPFVKGETLSYTNLSKENKIEIASSLRKMHDTFLPQDIRTLLPKETFDKYQDSAVRLITKAKEYTSEDKLLIQVSEFIKANWKVINKTLTNGRYISDYCKRNTYEMVVCHSDIHPSNVMKIATGLVMIDWDGVILAPRECDLKSYGSEVYSDSDFQRAYGRDYKVDMSLLTYYRYEWVLQEYTDYLQRLFDLGLNEQAREHALKEFISLFGEGEELGGVIKIALDSPMYK